jgi:HlyD family secretion protein
MKLHARWPWFAVLLLAIAAGVFLLLPRHAEVDTLTLERADAMRTLAVNGRIRPRQSVDVQSPVAGTLIALPFDVGDRVAAGATIARIDDGPQRAAIAEATAAIGAQEAILAQARRDLARFEALGQFVTRRQVEEARLAVQEGTRELQRRRAARTEAEEVQQRSVVRAPFGGVILERPVDRGQTVGPETILYRLADLAQPEISAEVDEDYAVELRRGTVGLVELAGRQRRLRAEVAHIEPRVDEATGAREVRLRFLDPPGAAPAGQTVSVNLVVERRPQALSLPRASILQPDSAPRVRIVDADGRVAEQAIRFIDWPAAEVIVTQGLQPGVRVLLDPSAAEPGERVKSRTPPSG